MSKWEKKKQINGIFGHDYTMVPSRQPSKKTFWSEVQRMEFIPNVKQGPNIPQTHMHLN